MRVYKEQAKAVNVSGSDKQILIYRTPQFERCLDDLHRRGNTAADAARRVEIILRNLVQSEDGNEREKFRYTRNGEYRIKHCRKISLGCGYRLVFIQKDGCYVFLYAGSHDDCFRWIERNKGLYYELDHTTRAITVVQDIDKNGNALPEDVREAREFAVNYEEELMRRLDDDLLARIFSGWCRDMEDRDRRQAHNKGV
jgi:hypothetical protein